MPPRGKPLRDPPDERLRALEVACGQRDEEHAERRPAREADAGVEDGSAFADHERAEEDPDREHDPVEEALGEERPGCHERGHVLLAQRLDAQEVAAAGGEEVVRRPTDRDGGEELALADGVARAGEKVFPAEGHEEDVAEDET